MQLDADAREQLRNAEISQAQWARHHFQDGTWHGDACGCPDDRCIGLHHDAHDDCQCLPALLAEHTPGRTAASVTASPAATVARRWKVRECTRCSASLAPGAEVYTLTTQHYEPMPDGPEWECVGDWAKGRALGGWICADCLDDLQLWLITGRLTRRNGND